GQDTTGAGYEKVTSAAQRAIALDPNLPEPYVTLAVAHLQYDHNWAASSEALAQVAKLDPNNTLAHQVGGHLSAAVGRISDAVALFRRAVDLDPLNLLHRKYLGRALHYAGRPTESLAALRHAMELNPQFPGLHYEQGRALLMLNESEAARASFEDEPDPSWRSFGLPLGNLATHHDKEARAALAAIVANSPGSEFQVAETYAFFGDKDQAFYWLEQARLHDSGIIYVRRDFLLAPLMSDPRYAALLKRLGMPPVSKDDCSAIRVRRTAVAVTPTQWSPAACPRCRITRVRD